MFDISYAKIMDSLISLTTPKGVKVCVIIATSVYVIPIGIAEQYDSTYSSTFCIRSIESSHFTSIAYQHR